MVKSSIKGLFVGQNWSLGRIGMKRGGKRSVEAEERKDSEEMSECDLQFLFSQHVREGRLCEDV